MDFIKNMLPANMPTGSIPPIDREIPKDLETATFALG